MKVPLLRPGMVLDMQAYRYEKDESIRVQKVNDLLLSEAAVQEEKLQDRCFYWSGKTALQAYVEALQ